MAALLRVADALDREHVQRVPRATARINKDDVVLILEGEGDLILESWALRRKSQFFARVFGKKITLRFAGEPEPTARS